MTPTAANRIAPATPPRQRLRRRPKTRFAWRKAFYWLGVGLCLAALAALGQWMLTSARPKQPAGPTLAASLFDAPWSADPVQFIALGPQGEATPAFLSLLAHNDDGRFPEMHGRDLASVFPGLRLGEDPPAKQAVIALYPGLSALLTPVAQGGLYGAPLTRVRWQAPRFRRDLLRRLRAARDRLPEGAEANVFLGNLPDPADGDARFALPGKPPWEHFGAALALYNQAMASLAGELPEATVVDLRALFRGHGRHAGDRGRRLYQPQDPSRWWEGDSSRFNERGTDAARRAFLLAMARTWGRGG